MIEEMGLKTGDTVKYIGYYSKGALGFEAVQNDRKYYSEGARYTIQSIKPGGIELVGGRIVPIHAILKSGPTIRISNSYSAEIEGNGSVRVGCTTLDFKLLKSIYDAAVAIQAK